MADLFFKYYFEDEDTTFYVQYQDGWIIKQVEISQSGKIFLSEDDPMQGDLMLADQPLEHADIDRLTPITKEQFDEMWNSR